MYFVFFPVCKIVVLHIYANGYLSCVRLTSIKSFVWFSLFCVPIVLLVVYSYKLIFCI
ncbi:hypothetical protein PPEP_a4343 [Pseudoalteromonas peptidolytica F12-50-A1]|uniref:Uncharacterized protein n=1 Tax=Pseudoalteromonas peptidolytica F12-50-A1 TaxID=1315280 RepID=A0A8I0MZ08_9GAMM|nr:hypothetical protein [Pseudoalteromonas peptidolytica F12-50-A1]